MICTLFSGGNDNMKLAKKTRLLAGLLAAIMIAAPSTVVSADGVSGSGSKASAAGNYETPSLSELLSTIKYDSYIAKYVDVAPGSETVVLSGDAITQINEEISNAVGVQEIVTENGTKLVYLPSDGMVGWTIDVPSTGMYNLVITYYPVNDVLTSGKTDSKTTSIERTFFINEKVPFYEARFLTMTKSWVDDSATLQTDSDGNTIYRFMKDGKVEYPYVVNGKCLERDTSTGKLMFVETGDTVDETALINDGMQKYPVYQNDVNGNEIKPEKDLILSSEKKYENAVLGLTTQLGERKTYTAVDSNGYNVAPLQFYIEGGKNTIQFQAQRESMAIESIKLVPVAEQLTYEQYKELHADAPAYSGGAIIKQAEYPLATSENTVYPTNDRTSYITQPQDASQLLLNVIGGDGGDKWKNLGQWVRWEIEVPETGWYKITLRFKQSVLEGTFSSRTLRVATQSMLDAGQSPELPFKEASYMQFGYSDDWQVSSLNDGTTTFNIYLEKGTNQIELEASLGNMADILRRVSASMTTVNSIYIKILMITGSEPDSNRDYGFYRIMPDEVDELLRQAEELVSISEEFSRITGSTGSHAKTLEKVAMLLERMGEDEDKIARNLSNLKENLGTLGTWLQTSTEQPLEIDYIAVEAPDSDTKKNYQANDNFFQTIWFEMIQFARSFVSDYNTLGSMEIVNEENTVEVWTTLGRDQAQIIRNLINTDFNKKHPGISVELKLVAGGSLLPSVLAGVGPDVSMGHGSGDVINWAIRSAVVPLNDMEGIEEVVGKYDPKQGYLGGSFDEKGNFEGAYFVQSAIVPLELFGEYDEDGDSVADRTDVTLYGLPETQSFSMMFYRADVFQNLGIEPPKTWDDLIAVLPVLQNNHMEIAMPNSLGGLNLFGYQMGGDLYAENGKRIGIDTDVMLSAFDYMCSFFSKYKCPYTYDFATRFRTGEIPLGIMDYGTYTHLSVYATEIKGLWEFVALPGVITEDAEGNVTGINNTAVSGVSALIMLHDEERTEEQTANAWEYMKWYVSADNQSSYANELTALLGTVSKHSTANVEALASLSWTTSEYNNLMSQFTNLAAIREYPGGYIIGRYVGFAFLAVYNDNAVPNEAILDYVVEINKEISRKRKEFDMTYLEISQSSNFTEEAD